MRGRIVNLKKGEKEKSRNERADKGVKSNNKVYRGIFNKYNIISVVKKGVILEVKFNPDGVIRVSDNNNKFIWGDMNIYESKYINRDRDMVNSGRGDVITVYEKRII